LSAAAEEEHNVEVTVVDKEPETPQFQTLLGVADKPVAD
jgi:hypothetical protein